MVKTAFCVILLLLTAGSAAGLQPTFGLGASGGLTIPIVQADQATGSNFGLRVFIRPIPMLGIETNLHLARYGGPDLGLEGVTNDLEGSHLTAYTLNALIGGHPNSRLSPFLLTGLGFFRTSRDQTQWLEDAETKFGWIAGAGFDVALGRGLALDIRGQLNIIPTDGGSSRKSAFVLGGLNYHFGGRKEHKQ